MLQLNTGKYTYHLQFQSWREHPYFTTDVNAIIQQNVILQKHDIAQVILLYEVYITDLKTYL